MEPDEYRAYPGYQADAAQRNWNLGYIDARDGAQAIRQALESDRTGADVFIIANAGTVMSRPSAELAAEVFPDVAPAAGVGPNETLFSIEKARQVPGYERRHSWREHR